MYFGFGEVFPTASGLSPGPISKPYPIKYFEAIAFLIECLNLLEFKRTDDSINGRLRIYLLKFSLIFCV